MCFDLFFEIMKENKQLRASRLLATRFRKLDAQSWAESPRQTAWSRGSRNEIEKGS
jgi:hypothetical protein